ncbi:MAG: purine-binding chemotaxis protein CheW [Micromonosporaceae bacterium]
MSGLSLVFRAASHLCALDVARVVEVMRPLPVRGLAGTPWFVRGVSVIRGVPTPVVDVNVLVGGQVDAERRFVLVTEAGQPVALAVAEVVGVRDLAGAALREAPALLRAAGVAVAEALTVLDAELLLILSESRIVPQSVWAALERDRAGA